MVGSTSHANPMKPALLSPISRCAVAVLLLVSGLSCPAVSEAASTPAENGAHLLLAELPAKVTLLSADCEQLASAVGRATLAHQPDAPAILRVALTRGLRKFSRTEGRLPCPCAKRIFGVSVAAAPTQASALLDLATELYPDCATELAGVMRDYDQVAYDYKDRVVDDKDVVDDKNGPARHAPGAAGASNPASADDPASAIQDRGDLTPRDLAGIGFGDSDGFSYGGLGAGFPGAPGFVGSPPSGGIALPPTVVTAVVNS